MNIAQKAISKISQKITRASNDIGNLWGGNERFFRDARGARIVVYHGLPDDGYQNNYKYASPLS
jgi:hypothetical protein